MKTSIFSPLICLVCESKVCYNELPFCEDCINELQKLLTKRCRGYGKPPSACACPENSELRFAFFYNGFFARRFVYTNKMYTDLRIVDFWAELAVAASGIKPSAYGGVTFVPRLNKNVLLYGYDQAELLARSVSKLYGIPFIKTLKRTGGKDQKLLSRSERFKNIMGRFKIRKDVKEEILCNKILLIDDVSTTGATVKASAEVLRGRLARGVVPLVLAKTDFTNDRGEKQ